MQKIFANIRYGSGTFLYIISSYIVLGLSSKLCADVTSFISFFIFSLLILPLVTKAENVKLSYIQKYLLYFTLLSLTAFELSYVLKIFKASSDNATTVPGTFVFATIIFTVAFICALFGSYTAIKLSNIIFIIPVTALFLSLLAYIKTGISLDILDVLVTKNPLNSILQGISASVITFSDVYIVNYMHKKENCFESGKQRLAYIISLITIILFTIVYKTMFGNYTSLLIDVPTMSSFGIILESGLNEIFLLIYSICFLYRTICRICFCFYLHKQKRRGKLFCSVLFLISVNIGALASLNAEAMLFSGVISLYMMLLCFIISPLFEKIKTFRKKP